MARNHRDLAIKPTGCGDITGERFWRVIAGIRTFRKSTSDHNVSTSRSLISLPSFASPQAVLLGYNFVADISINKHQAEGKLTILDLPQPSQDEK
jgi:hypothetical protein